MRLRRLELTNFRNFEHLVLDFTQDRTLFLAENGLGKSTIFDAISWLLTGQCRGVDGKGAGQKDLIRFGADAMNVTAVIDGLGPAVSRSISRNGSSTTTMPTDVILGKLDVAAGMLATVLSGRAFFTMHHSEAKAMLMQLLNVQVPKDKLPGVDLPDTVAAADLATLEQLYTAAFDKRKTVKAQLAGVHVPEQPKVVQIDLGGKTLAEVQATLTRDTAALKDQGRDQRDAEAKAADVRAKLVAATKLAGSREQLQGSLTAHRDMLTEHEGQLATAQAALTAANAEPGEHVGALGIQLRETATLIDQISRHATASTLEGTMTGGPKGKGGKKKATIPVQADQGHGCVLGGGIPCLTAISEFTGAVEQLKAKQTDLEARIKAGNERARKIAAAEQAVKESERHVGYHQGQVRDNEAKLAAAEQAAADMPGLDRQLTLADDAVAKGLQAVQTLMDDVNRRQQLVASLAGYEAAQKAHQAGLARKADLEAEVQKAEDLVALLGPKGIRLQYLDAALSDFQQAVNAALEPFGFSLSINVEPWRVEVTRGDDVTNTCRFDLLSKGQQLWTALAFQVTLAALSGLDFAILDDAEAVVGVNRAIITEFILGAPVGQVLVAMAKAEDDQAPDIEGLQVYRIGSMTGSQLTMQ